MIIGGLGRIADSKSQRPTPDQLSAMAQVPSDGSTGYIAYLEVLSMAPFADAADLTVLSQSGPGDASVDGLIRIHYYPESSDSVETGCLTIGSDLVVCPISHLRISVGTSVTQLS